MALENILATFKASKQIKDLLIGKTHKIEKSIY